MRVDAERMHMVQGVFGVTGSHHRGIERSLLAWSGCVFPGQRSCRGTHDRQDQSEKSEPVVVSLSCALDCLLLEAFPVSVSASVNVSSLRRHTCTYDKYCFPFARP